MRKESIMVIVLLILFAHCTLFGGEKPLKPLNTYRFEDFHFAKPVVYMDIVTFHSKPSDGKTFMLPKDYKFETILKVGKLNMSDGRKKRDFDYLAHAILKKDYFWKAPWPPVFIYDFTSLRFMEKDDPRLKAITEPQDILDLFGDIDTIAELHVWLKATYLSKEPVLPNSWKKEGNLYRIHYEGINPFTCYYHNYFEYFNTKGKRVKTHKIKSYREKKCTVIMY